MVTLQEIDLIKFGDNMNYPSYMFGRTGSCDETTGLFVFEGGTEDYKIAPHTIAAVASSRDGYEINSRIPFEDGQVNPNVQFLNNTRLHAKRPGDWAGAMHPINPPGTGPPTPTDLEQMVGYSDSMFYTFHTRKMAERRYINEVVGLIPGERVIKTILRAKGVATKRIILFGSCMDPEDGGALWVVSPHGFPWRDTKKHILDEGDDEDLERCFSQKDFLFMGMTGSVPFISGHRQRQPDEEWPRILRIPSGVETKEYHTLLDAHVAEAVTGGLTDLSTPVEFAKNLYIQTKLMGKVEVKPTDLLGEGTISLSDSDMLI